MPQVNIPGSGHGEFTSAAGNRFWEYKDEKIKKMLDQAIWIIEHNVTKMKSCDECFKKLPGGRTFNDVWKDAAIWINFEPRKDRDWYGVTRGVGGKDISISQSAFDKGKWWVAGTLVHELAHTNGASATTGDADKTLLKCGLSSAYEGAIGLQNIAQKDFDYA
jgi:hypothetical protein